MQYQKNVANKQKDIRTWDSALLFAEYNTPTPIPGQKKAYNVLQLYCEGEKAIYTSDFSIVLYLS